MRFQALPRILRGRRCACKEYVPIAEIQRADFLGRCMARRGFWDATFPNTPGGKVETTPSARGNTNRPEPVELFGAVSVFILIRKTTEERTPLLEPSRCRRVGRILR